MSNLDKIIIGVFIILILFFLWNKKEHLDATYSYLDVSGFYNNVKFNKNVDINGNMMVGQDLLIRRGQVANPESGPNGFGPNIRLTNTNKTTTGTARSWRIINNKEDTTNNIAGGLQFTTYDQGADTAYKNVAFNDKGSVDIFRGNLNLYGGNVNIWDKKDGEKIWSNNNTQNALLEISKVYADPSTNTPFNFNNIIVDDNITTTNNIFPNDAKFSQNITVGGNITSGGNITPNGNITGKRLHIENSSSDGIGGSIDLTNTNKMNQGTAKTWTLYNMASDHGYEDALEFWTYDASGIGRSPIKFMDNGDITTYNYGTTDNPTGNIGMSGDLYSQGYKLFNCGWSGEKWLNGSSAQCSDDLILTCTNGYLTNARFACDKDPPPKKKDVLWYIFGWW